LTEKKKIVRLGIETMKCMMQDAYAKIDTIFFVEGLVKVIINNIRNIVSFDNFEILRTIPLRKSKARDKVPNKAKV
jgi:hypothetical protein